MARSSPRQLNKKSNQEQLPLYDALKRGAIALHNYELIETGKGKRELPFKVKTGISYGMTIKGRKQKRIYIYVTYAKTNDGKKAINKEMIIAIKDKIPIHVGRIKGAFWIILSMSKRGYERIKKSWSMAFKKGLAWLIYLLLLVYVILHPELKDLIMKIIEIPLIPVY